MTDFQLAVVSVPFVAGVVGLLYFWRASIAFDRKYGRDPE